MTDELYSGEESYLSKIGMDDSGGPITSSKGVLEMSPEEVLLAANLEARAQGLPVEEVGSEDATLYGLAGDYSMEVSDGLMPQILVGERQDQTYLISHPTSQFDLSEIDRREMLTSGRDARKTVADIVNEFGVSDRGLLEERESIGRNHGGFSRESGMEEYFGDIL